MFTPDTCEAVSTAVKALSFFKIEFAIRSGGHTPFAGGAGTEGGVLLSLEKLNNLSLNEDKSITGVGAGLRWQAVYEYLADFGLACVGGRVPDVGVGGLLTGGGLSLHVNHYGFSCDMVQNFQVVLADGTIVNASSTENSDLFRALKGGSNNFGVVTRFDLYTVPAPNGVWGGLLMFLPDKYDQVLETLVEYQTTHQIEDSQSGMVLNFAFADSGKLQAVANYILHPEIDNPPSLSAWKELGPVMDLTKRAPLPVIVNETYNGFQILLATLRYAFPFPAA